MRVEDIDQVHALDRLSFTLPWPASAFRYELMENPHSLLWVVETGYPGPQIVGMAVTWIILDEAHIASIAVHPDYRRHGIGAWLLLISLRDAIKNGVSSATLEVRAGNLAAQRLYRRFRFEEVGRRPRYYRDNDEDAILMTVQVTRPVGQRETYLEWLERGGWSHDAGGDAR